MPTVAVFAALTSVAASFGAVEPPELGTPPLAVAAKCLTPPVLDGVLGEACWHGAQRLGPFVDIRNHSLAQEQTRACLAWDDQHLYVAFDCAESQMNKLVLQARQRDADGLWNDDCVELFVQRPGSAEYFHWVVSASGVIFDERCGSQTQRDTTWNSAAAAQTQRSAGSWQVELAIPWTDLGGAPAPGDTWRINLNREEKPRDEWSGWAVTANGFHEPAAFGEVRFETETLPIEVYDPGRLFLGKSVSVIKGSGTIEGARADVTGTGSMISSIWNPQADVWEIAYQVPHTGWNRVGFVITKHDVAVFRSAEMPFYVDPLDQQALALKARTEALGQQMAKFKWGAVSARASSFREQGLEITRQVEDLNKQVRQAMETEGTASPSHWAALGGVAQELDRRLKRLEMVFAAWERAGGREPPAYEVCVAPSTVKVLRDVPFSGNPSHTGRLQMARNEHEALQFVITPVTHDLEGIEVTWGDLVGSTGTPLPASCVEVRRVGYVQTRKPGYPVDYVGWYPDPLMPLDRFGVKLGQNQPLWVAVKTPRNLLPDFYRGELTIKPANAPPMVLTLEVEVWDLALPQTTTLKTAISNWWTDFAGWYGLTELPTELRRKYFQFWLERRINPGTIYSGQPYWDEEDIRWCVERGMNAFAIKYQGPLGGDTPEEQAANDKALAEWARDYAAMLRRNGWIDKGYVYGFDEVQPPGYPDVVRAYKIIKEAAPDLRTACTVVPNETLNPVIDIWVPLTPALENKDIWNHMDKTDEMWWYVCCGPTHPYANWFIDYSALEHRLLFWQTFKYRVTGFLYYAVAMWHSNRTTVNEPSYIVPHEDPEALKMIAEGKRWPEVPWNTFTFDHVNGDGHLYYPGRDFTMIPSQRLENIRDGIEDYELLHELAVGTQRLEDIVYLREDDAPLLPSDLPWLRHAVAQSPYTKLLAECKQLLGPRPKLFKDLTHYTSDPQVLENERLAVAKQLMRLKDLLRSLPPPKKKSAL